MGKTDYLFEAELWRGDIVPDRYSICMPLLWELYTGRSKRYLRCLFIVPGFFFKVFHLVEWRWEAMALLLKNVNHSQLWQWFEKRDLVTPYFCPHVQLGAIDGFHFFLRTERPTAQPYICKKVWRIHSLLADPSLIISHDRCLLQFQAPVWVHLARVGKGCILFFFLWSLQWWMMNHCGKLDGPLA